MVGRLVTFLPSTKAKAVVTFPRTSRTNWWSFATQHNSDGVLEVREHQGFTVIVFDFELRTPRPLDL